MGHRSSGQRSFAGASSDTSDMRTGETPGLRDRRDVVRRTVLEFYDRGEYVTCDKLKNVLRDKIGFRGGRDSMWKVFKKSKHGFIEGAELVFQSKCTGDYHKEMNHEVFTEWFVDMLKLLDEGCIVVMDNASYHSKLKEKIPSSKTKKKDITEWLTSKGIPHNPRHTVRELLNIVRSHRKEYKRFEIDDIALWMGHEVVRLPPYHCQYNPIELIWSQVKGEVAEQNKTFKIKDVRNLLEESIKRVTVEDWKNCVRHSENIQKEDFLKEIGIRDDNFQRIVVDLQNDTTDSDSTDDIDMESTDGIEF
ncbi:uncharacterized protein LOC128989347 [Macrosteles quadrilineatus]|uniref:uncharacterized protein LOC128989347 n=1 Tax=Macrosteles quadrilineatus TaxID=74068 RepID=UPI0023E0D3FE|nr:uncharacterized protein LOC128989347 [Macrosteles quadrilineatus]